MDGKEILFKQGGFPDGIVQSVNLADRSTRYLTNGEYPVWMDGGKAVATLHLDWDEDYKTTGVGDIYRFDINENRETQLTTGNRVLLGIAASPSGEQIAFRTYETVGDTVEVPFYIMSSDGSNRKMLTSNVGAFSWEPDGKHLLFASDCQIYRIGLDGTISGPLNLPEGYCYWYAAQQPVPGQ
jgi:Tol biopolymer transport system component